MFVYLEYVFRLHAAILNFSSMKLPSKSRAALSCIPSASPSNSSSSPNLERQYIRSLAVNREPEKSHKIGHEPLGPNTGQDHVEWLPEGIGVSSPLLVLLSMRLPTQLEPPGHGL